MQEFSSQKTSAAADRMKFKLKSGFILNPDYLILTTFEIGSYCFDLSPLRYYSIGRMVLYGG